MKIPALIPIIAAVVLMSLGGFVIMKYGSARYEQGYNRCVIDAQNIAAKIRNDLDAQRDKNIKDSDVLELLIKHEWMRDESDR